MTSPSVEEDLSYIMRTSSSPCKTEWTLAGLSVTIPVSQIQRMSERGWSLLIISYGCANTTTADMVEYMWLPPATTKLRNMCKD